MAGTITSLSTVNNFVQEIWSQNLRDDYQTNLVFEPLLDHTFEQETAGTPTDLIRINGFNEFDAATGDIATTGITEAARLTYDEANYQSQVTIDVDQHFYKAFAYEKTADVFSNIPQMEKLKELASRAVSVQLDAYIAGFADDLTTNTLGALGVELSDENVLRAQRLLNDVNVPDNDRFMVISSPQDEAFKAVDKYQNSDYVQTSVDVNAGPGAQGRLYGFDVFMSTAVEGSNAAGHDNVAFQREWLAIVSKDRMREEGPFYDIDTDSNKFVVHNYYGVDQIREPSAVFMRGS